MTASKWPKRLVLYLGIIAIILAVVFRVALIKNPGSVKTDISSMLKDVISISELSTAEFRYRGIAEVYTDEKKTKVRCRVCYSAIVKAGVDVKDIQVGEVDESNRTIPLILPGIDLKVTIVDEQSMNTLPSNADVRVDTMLRCCREDAENEARQSGELIETARENLKATIEGMAFPILKSQGYTIVWQ